MKQIILYPLALLLWATALEADYVVLESGRIVLPVDLPQPEPETSIRIDADLLPEKPIRYVVSQLKNTSRIPLNYLYSDEYQAKRKAIFWSRASFLDVVTLSEKDWAKLAAKYPEYLLIEVRVPNPDIIP